jgi:hypothetical protein
MYLLYLTVKPLTVRASTLDYRSFTVTVSQLLLDYSSFTVIALGHRKFPNCKTVYCYGYCHASFVFFLSFLGGNSGNYWRFANEQRFNHTTTISWTYLVGG